MCHLRVEAGVKGKRLNLVLVLLAAECLWVLYVEKSLKGIFPLLCGKLMVSQASSLLDCLLLWCVQNILPMTLE